MLETDSSLATFCFIKKTFLSGLHRRLGLFKVRPLSCQVLLNKIDLEVTQSHFALLFGLLTFGSDSIFRVTIRRCYD